MKTGGSQLERKRKLYLLPVFSDFESDKIQNIFSKVYVRENLSCSIAVELTYYSSNIFPDVCIHCGTKQNLLPTSTETYPRCRGRACSKQGDVLRRKRKIITSNDLNQKKSKSS